MALLRSDTVPNNLPVALSSFVGREPELAELGGLLGHERLVTLTGAGGCGKTRLALQAASGALDRFPDGAWWVELAPLAETELVGAAIAARERSGSTPLSGLECRDGRLAGPGVVPAIVARPLLRLGCGAS
jgi:hypothetical protein